MPLIDIIALLITVLALLYAMRAFRATQTQIKQQVYHDLMSEYRRPEMLAALDTVGGLAALTRGNSIATIAMNYRSQLLTVPNLRVVMMRPAVPGGRW
jgi:hypothetical protein